MVDGFPSASVRLSSAFVPYAFRPGRSFFAPSALHDFCSENRVIASSLLLAALVNGLAIRPQV